MRFSSKEFFEYLKTEIANPSGSGDVYRDLVDALRSDVSYRIFTRIERKEDRDDTFQEVCLGVYIGLVDFLTDPQSEKSEANRNAWLFQIVGNKICDFFRKNFTEIRVVPTKEEIAARLEEARQKALDRGATPKEVQEAMDKELDKCYTKLISDSPLYINPDQETWIEDQKHNPEDEVIWDDINPRLEDYIRKILDVKTSPDKLIAFIFSKIIIPVELGGHISGKPRYAAAELKGYTLFELVDKMKHDLSYALRVTLPDDLFISIERVLYQTDEFTGGKKKVGDRKFGLSSAQIASGTNRILDKIDPNREQGKTEDKPLDKQLQDDNQLDQSNKNK